MDLHEYIHQCLLESYKQSLEIDRTSLGDAPVNVLKLTVARPFTVMDVAQRKSASIYVILVCPFAR